MKDPTLRRILIFFLLIAAVLVVVAVQAVRNIGRSGETSDWVNHTHTVLLELEALRGALSVGDGTLHKYVFTGDARDMGACREALANVTDRLVILKAMTRLEPGPREQVEQLEPLVNARLDFMREVLAARQANRMPEVRSLLDADAGSADLREIHRRLERLKNDELGLLTERDTASYRQAQATRWTVLTGVILDVLLLGGIAWLIRDDLAARRKVADTLQGANEQLEIRVLERTAELADANRRLSTENLERQWTNQALEHQLRYNQLIVDSISDLVLVLTKARNITRVNPAVVNLTGLEPSSLINQPLSRFVKLAPPPSGSGKPLLDPVARSLKEGRDLRDLSAFVEDTSGRHIAVLLSLYPLRDGDKVVGGIVALRVTAATVDSKA